MFAVVARVVVATAARLKDLTQHATHKYTQACAHARDFPLAHLYDYYNCVRSVCISPVYTHKHYVLVYVRRRAKLFGKCTRTSAFRHPLCWFARTARHVSHTREHHHHADTAKDRTIYIIIAHARERTPCVCVHV